jgi:NAD-dependent deacetylase
VAERLAELIRENQPCVVLTGAGISTESGVPDFRSPTGMWARFDPLEYGNLGAFRRDPEKVWRFYAPRFSMLADAEPNEGHRALAELEARGYVHAVITQNIDLLHERAGSRDVLEVHGSIRTSSCPRCARTYPLAEVLQLVDAGEGVPRCHEDGAVLKPDVVFFDELLPAEAVDRAYALAEEARILLVVGSSLEVWPVAKLPSTTLRAGGLVAVVNDGPTSADARAALKVEGRAGDVLGAVLSELRPTRSRIEIVDYNPVWPTEFQSEAEAVSRALGPLVVAIEHIGSTSVPGLAGKPVIDLLVGSSSLDLAAGQIEAMESLGYAFRGELGLEGRLFFFQKGAETSSHHVHAVLHGEEQWHRHLAFREYLRANPDEATRYAAAKRRLAAEASYDWYEYVERKDAFVSEVFPTVWRWYVARLGNG